jgi:lipoprotein signal peptidase
VIAGALGNLGDRLLNGAGHRLHLVRFFPYVFNVADAAITVGGSPGGALLLRSAPETASGAARRA